MAPRLLSYVDNSLSCSRHDMLYQEVQGLSERMYILRFKVLKPNDLKTPPQKLINFLLRKNEKLLLITQVCRFLQKVCVQGRRER